MKRILMAFYALFIIAGAVQAQQNVGIGTTSPAPSAALDVQSSSQGVLVPRMTSTQRDNIPNPAKGLMVYDSTVNNFYHYDGTAWKAVGGSGIGAIIPFSSGTPAVLSSTLGSMSNQVAAIGFGSNGMFFSMGEVIVTSGGIGRYNFIAPVDGVITDITASFEAAISAVTALPLTVNARIYTQTGSILWPLGPAVPVFISSGTIMIGQSGSVSSHNLSLPVTAGTQLAMIFSISSEQVITLSGYCNAGIVIR